MSRGEDLQWIFHFRGFFVVCENPPTPAKLRRWKWSVYDWPGYLTLIYYCLLLSSGKVLGKVCLKPNRDERQLNFHFLKPSMGIDNFYLASITHTISVERKLTENSISLSPCSIVNQLVIRLEMKVTKKQELNRFSDRMIASLLKLQRSILAFNKIFSGGKWKFFLLYFLFLFFFFGCHIILLHSIQK